MAKTDVCPPGTAVNVPDIQIDIFSPPDGIPPSPLSPAGDADAQASSDNKR